MRLHRRLPEPPVFVVLAKSVLSVALSVACVLTLGVDLPFPAAAAGPVPEPVPAPAKDKKPKPDPALKGLPITELSAEEAILHALNRLAYGPRPGDVERVRQMGLAKWIDQQLNPNSIDDKAVEARLQAYPTLPMSSATLLAEYPQPKQAEKQAVKQAQGQPTRSDAAAAVVARDMQTSRGRPQPGQGQPPAQAPSAADDAANTASPAPLAAGDPETSPMKQDPSQPANAATRGVGGKRDVLGVDPNAVPRALADDSKKPQRVVEELAMAKMTRAIYSQRQLQQILDDFWFNHFNVFAGKGDDRWLLTSYERDVVQPHTLGKFKDLLTATAKSPAMLFYLDNFLSADPRAAERAAAERRMRQQARWGRFPPRAPQAQPQKKNERGLNENYGRELMELHTLGVEGGYTQKDVTEVARCFTGWSIEKPRVEATFKFEERLHDPDPKLVLGKKIHAGGLRDGEEVIDLLVHHPSTARFISTKLARRFVSDNPPPALVARMAQTFQSSDGDIRAVMKTMIYSPEFWSRDAYRAKVKTPFELVVSTARALGTDVDTPMPLVQWAGRIGEPLYQCQPPTGYSDKADAWVNTGALLNRLNYSLALAGNKVRGSRSDAGSLLGTDSLTDAKAALDRAVQLFLGGQTGPMTVETLEKQLDSPQILQAKLDDPVKHVDLGVVAGLVLGAPEFQRR
jgi:uncharacterized protein (DUF1800 family)